MLNLKPTSPGRRFVIRVSREHLDDVQPYRRLCVSKNSIAGRNNDGRITVRHQGGGHKQKYRIIDFRRNKDNIKARVESLQYDPCRTSHIALVLYEDGERRYIIAPQDLQVGSIIESADKCAIKVGNSMAISNIPTGTVVHNVELRPGKGGQIARSAGSSVQIISRDNKYTNIRLKSGEIRRILGTCRATVGSVSNQEHNLISYGKAGAKRWLGIRPTVRGTAMNPIDHPHGGGEGRTRGKHPVTPWGKKTKGLKTRNNKRTDQFIMKRKNRR